LAAWSAGLRLLRRPAEAEEQGAGKGLTSCRGYAEARVQSRKRLREAAPRAPPKEAPPGPLGLLRLGHGVVAGALAPPSSASPLAAADTAGSRAGPEPGQGRGDRLGSTAQQMRR
jgi:hypothetical protein